MCITSLLYVGSILVFMLYLNLFFKGPWMRSKQLAKMAVALKTCEELHKAGIQCF